MARFVWPHSRSVVLYFSARYAAALFSAGPEQAFTFLAGKYIGENPAGARFNLFPGYMARYNASLAKDAVADYVQVRHVARWVMLHWLLDNKKKNASILAATRA